MQTHHTGERHINCQNGSTVTTEQHKASFTSDATKNVKRVKGPPEGITFPVHLRKETPLWPRLYEDVISASWKLLALAFDLVSSPDIISSRRYITKITVDLIEDSRPGHHQETMSSKDETLSAVAAVLLELIEGNQTLASLNSSLVRSSELTFPRSCQTMNYGDCQGHKAGQGLNWSTYFHH